MNLHTLMPGRATRHILLLSTAAFALSACGENLFDTSSPPELNDFMASQETVVEGDTIVYTANASGPRRIERIRLELSGAMEGDTTFVVDEPSTDVSATIRLAVPNGTGPGSQLTATAYAIDVAPDTSEAMTAQVGITDATEPMVAATVTPEQAGAGEVIDIAVQATDNRGLETIGATVTNGVGYDTTLSAAAGGALEFDETFQLDAPAMDMGAVTVTPFAVDVNGFSANGDPAAVGIADLQGPTFLSLQTNPDSTIPLNDSLQVVVEVADPSGIQRVTFVGLAYRGVPSMGTDSVVTRFAQRTIEFPRPTEGDELPTSYTLNPYLVTRDEVTAEPVEVFVIAEDSLGNVSDTTKLMYVGGPDVAIEYPPEDFAVGLGADFNVQISIDDGAGIDSARLVLSGSGVSTPIIPLSLPARTDTPFVIEQPVTMPATAGTVEMQAVAWNPSEVAGQSRRVQVEVLQEPPSDTIPPVVSLRAERLVPSSSDTRMELLDQIRVTVSAFDGNSGLARIGLTAVVSRGGEQYQVTEDVTFDGSRSREQLVFQVPVDSLYELLLDEPVTGPLLDSILPEDLDVRIHGFAADMVGEVACAVGREEQRSCTPDGYSPTTFYEAADTSGLLMEIEAVRGVTVLLDNRDATIADLAVDTAYDRLYLSNITENLVEVLELDADFRASSFRASPVQVGAEPWGIFLGERVVSANEVGFSNIGVAEGERLRTLIVANSGGTNMSLVHLDPDVSRVQEVDVVRLRTDNAVLFEIAENNDEFGNVRYGVEYIDLADRPQFLAQDSLLRIVYSTIETDAAPLSSVRFVHVDPDTTSVTDRPEVRFMLTADMVDPQSERNLVLANIDSLHIRSITGLGDSVRVFTHEPGYPNDPGAVIYNTTWTAQIATAVADVTAQIDAVMTARGMGEQAPMFYPFFMNGTWDLDDLAWSDTTYVSASGDRGRIAIGEGASAPTGRIMLWHADERARYSDAIQMTDLVNNASEEVLGVGLNEDGSLGVARGREATYFFTPDLRLQGLYRQADLGGAGAAFHPEHDEVSDGGHVSSDGAGVAFTGTSNHSIDVVNTFHFNQVNTLTIRDDVVGPLVAGPPLHSDNGGVGAQCVALAATEAERKDCIVAKLYGITSAGGVVVVNVRRRDLEPYALP